MTLVRAASGIYEADFRRKGVKRLHVSLKTKSKPVAKARHAALDKLFRQKRIEMIEQVRTGALPIERLESMVEHHEPLVPVVAVTAAGVESWGTIDENADRYLSWLEAHPRRSAGTHTLAMAQLKVFREFVFEGQRTGDRDVSDVSRHLIEAYQKTFLDADRSPNVTTNHMARVKALWTWMGKEEGRDATEQRRAPRPLYSPIDTDKLVREFRPRERFLSAAEIERLFASTPEPLLFPIYCGVGAGLRLGEMLHLRPRIDVDLVSNTISIREKPIRGGKLWKPKTRRSKRVMPMSDDLCGIAERHIAQYASETWMIPGQGGRDSMTEGGFRLQFKAVVERAGMTYGLDQNNPDGVTFHTLRHTFASHAVMQGVDLYSVAQLLGDSLETVEATYAHLAPDYKRNAMAKVAAVIKLTQGVPQE